ncbi:hypothetical protein E2562_029447 [Oryza meyeriana var. granulata]|uniref:Uncharacterized protein n=1 Tax=Oryza meyeriana var. granulata TaxID=110450 RepID=A0A6G1E4S0_9ORYZ|nr:hypothetical protein E2562_029447 [Oryza meyeriana var. granulata]
MSFCPASAYKSTPSPPTRPRTSPRPRRLTAAPPPLGTSPKSHRLALNRARARAKHHPPPPLSLTSGHRGHRHGCIPVGDLDLPPPYAKFPSHRCGHSHPSTSFTRFPIPSAPRHPALLPPVSGRPPYHSDRRRPSIPSDGPLFPSLSDVSS